VTVLGEAKQKEWKGRGFRQHANSWEENPRKGCRGDGKTSNRLQIQKKVGWGGSNQCKMTLLLPNTPGRFHEVGRKDQSKAERNENWSVPKIGKGGETREKKKEDSRRVDWLRLTQVGAHWKEKKAPLIFGGGVKSSQDKEKGRGRLRKGIKRGRPRGKFLAREDQERRLI